ncbi:hypothetical protein OOK13_41455 [Streptomyces sp. NBC_00378]|uniref:hypothetical protein n=1 Tax=unclassified Streptomyces TaxID=2593676 RepID=UPI00224C998D|nr:MULTISPECIES: hypothetical protein [unclassified Streptomyces]MCX5114809.1 hypothetical protein [Streptomyces sp. NBC_00378]
MLCGQSRDGAFLECGEVGNGLVPLSEVFLELGDLGLESFDLRDPWVDDLTGFLQSTKAPLELLAPWSAASMLATMRSARSASATSRARSVFCPRPILLMKARLVAAELAQTSR